MCSVSRIPIVKLLGIQPGGLNATSEGELRAFYDTIEAYQKRFFGPQLRRLINFLMLSLWDEVDPDITFEFESLWALTEKEAAEVRKIEAETDDILVNGCNALHPEDVRKRVAADPTTPYADIDVDDVPEPPDPDMGDPGQLGGKPNLSGTAAFGGGAGGEGGGQDSAIPFFGSTDAAFREEDHPRAENGEFGAGGGGAKKPARLTPTERSTELSTAGEEPVFKTKKDHAAHLLEKGATAKDLMTALGWPSISVPATAKSVGMNLRKVKEGKETKYFGTPMSAAERKANNLMPEGVRRSGGPRSRDPSTWSLLEFIVSRGGIDPKDPLIGDVRSLIGTKNKFVPGFGSLIRPGGMKLDRMREAVVEAGYIQDSGFNSQTIQGETTVGSLLDAMGEEERGNRIYQNGQEPEHATAAKRAETIEENQRHYDEQLDNSLTEAGIDPGTIAEKQRERIIQIMTKEGISDPLEAIEREAMEWNNDASETGKADRILDEIPGWDVPDDAGPAPKSSGTAAPF